MQQKGPRSVHFLSLKSNSKDEDVFEYKSFDYEEIDELGNDKFDDEEEDVDLVSLNFKIYYPLWSRGDILASLFFLRWWDPDRL